MVRGGTFPLKRTSSKPSATAPASSLNPDNFFRPGCRILLDFWQWGWYVSTETYQFCNHSYPLGMDFSWISGPDRIQVDVCCVSLDPCPCPSSATTPTPLVWIFPGFQARIEFRSMSVVYPWTPAPAPVV